MSTTPDAVTGAAPGEVCGVCAAPLRSGARFCGRCGGEHGLMVPRELGVGDERAPAPRDRRPLRGRGLVVAMAGYFAMFLPSMVLLARDRAASADEIASVELFAGLVGLIGLGVLGRDALRALVPRLPPARVAALALLATAAVFGGVVLLERALPWMFADTGDMLDVTGRPTLIALLYVAVIPAVSEEILFRGTVLSGLTDLMRDGTAVIASALVFAIAHVSVPSMLHLTALGLVLGWVRLRSGSVWPGVLLHAGYNAAVLLAGA